jgi:RNA polymerase subunit RPABC4/transcription elongation factor Spt4
VANRAANKTRRIRKLVKKLASKRDKRLLTEAEIKEKSLNKSDFTSSWQGRIYVANAQKSFIAKEIGIQGNGEYAIKVK